MKGCLPQCTFWVLITFQRAQKRTLFTKTSTNPSFRNSHKLFTKGRPTKNNAMVEPSSNLYTISIAYKLLPFFKAHKHIHLQVLHKELGTLIPLKQMLCRMPLPAWIWLWSLCISPIDKANQTTPYKGSSSLAHINNTFRRLASMKICDWLFLHYFTRNRNISLVFFSS